MAICTGQRCPMQVGYYVEQCEHTDCPYRTKPHTNADRIRSMGDEELANWLARTQYANMMESVGIFGAQLPFEEKTLKGTEKECLEWLKQPAEVE